jgi:hypothetical protein
MGWLTTEAAHHSLCYCGGAQSRATIDIYIYNTLMPYTDANGNKRMWYPDMAVCQTIGRVMTASLADKRHRVGLLISPLSWVGVTTEVGIGEDGEEFIAYPPGHVPLFFVVAAPPGKFGKTLAIWDSDAEGEIPRQVKEGSRCRYHCGFAKASPESNTISIST